MISRIREHLPSKEEVKEIGKNALLTGTLELPDNKYRFSLSMIKQLVLFIYFMIQLIYPVIIIALEQDFHGYNITCFAISFVALLSQIFDIPKFLKTCKKLWKCCKKCHYEKDEEVKLCCDCCEGDRCKKCSKWLNRITVFISENLVFPSVICNLIGLINQKTWELNTGLDYLDLGLFVLGIFTDLVLVKGKLIWKYLVFRYLIRKELRNKGKTSTKCPCCDPYNILMFYLVLREIMHIAMFGMVTCKLYADKHSGSEDKPEEGSYRIEGNTWFSIAAAWYMPTISFLCFIMINIYMYYRTAFLLAKEEHDDSDVFVSTDLLLCSCVRNPCAIVLIYILLPTYFAFNVTATAQYEVVPSALTTTWVWFQIIFNVCFIIAHIQALLFHILLCQIPCVYCFICICTNAGRIDNSAAIRTI